MTFSRWLVACAVGATLVAGCGTSDGRGTFPTIASTSSEGTANVDADRAHVIAAAVAQVTKIDNTFGGSKVTTVVHVVDNFDADHSGPFGASARAAVVDALRSYADVIFVAASHSLIGDNPMSAPRGLFIVTVGEPKITGDHAEIRTSMWCGSLCGTERTYSVDRQASGWRVTGTVGTIRIS